MGITGVHSAANLVYQTHLQSQQQANQANQVQQNASDPDHDGDIDGKGRDIDIRA